MKDLELIEQTYEQLKSFWQELKDSGKIQDFDINAIDLSIVHLQAGRIYPEGGFTLTIKLNEFTSIEMESVLRDSSEG